jgi:RNA polymerase sigma-70 factor (ECF subfamily)
MQKIRSEDWFKEVFNRYYDHLRNYLYYLSGDIEWADDALQDVFMVVWEKRNNVKEDTLQSFLFTIGRNIFLKHNRRKAVHLKFEKQNQEVNHTKSPEDEILDKEFDRHLQEAISGLPEKCRTVFLMSKKDGMTNQQIADNLRVSVKAVEKQITKAFKILRDKLKS